MEILVLTDRIVSTVDDNGTVALFYGAEIQLAQSADVASIKAVVDAYLDATISSRASQTTATAIKSNTDLIPATL